MPLPSLSRHKLGFESRQGHSHKRPESLEESQRLRPLSLRAQKLDHRRTKPRGQERRADRLLTVREVAVRFAVCTTRFTR